MLESGPKITDSSRVNWEKDIGMEHRDSDWGTISLSVHKASWNIAIREQYYKMQHQWYLTPLRISRMFLGFKDFKFRGL